MTSLKGKAGVSKAVERSFARRSGNGGFKIYSEDEKPKNEASAMAESAGGSKGVPLTVAKDSKAALKSMAKSKGKRDNSANRFAPRKALTDLSNLSSNVSGIKVYDGSKAMKNERNALLDRVSVASAARSVKTKNSDPKSAVTINRTTKNSLVPTRKSLPASKKEKATEAGRTIIKAKASGSATQQANNAKSRLQKDGGSDDFVILPSKVESNAAAHILPRSFKPIVKTAIRASSSRRTSKSKCSSGTEKPVSTAAIYSEEKEAECSQQKKNGAVISNEASQRDIPSNGNSDATTNMPEILSQKKTKRRRSYTSLLMTRKLLEDCGGVKEEEKLPAIDDETNPLEVAHYIDEIYQYYWISEAHSPSLENYMSIQTDINPAMRGILINWLIEVHLKFDLMQETLYLMVTLLDRYLSEVQIKKSDMQLVGLTTLLLASKYEDFWHPRVKDLISISAETYTREQMLKMEKLVLKILKFRLNAPTPYVFMLRLIKAAQSDTKLEHLAFYLIELSLVEYEALKFKASMLCASAIYVARCTLQVTPFWTQLLCRHARYDISEIRECAEMILRFQKAAGSGKLKVTYEKFMSGELSEVAVIKPLDTLPST